MFKFKKTELIARFKDPFGDIIKRVQQIRIDPLTLQTCRITPGRSLEKERGIEQLYHPPATDLNNEQCPFCPKNIQSMTPGLLSDISHTPRLQYNESILFPNLFPYTEWSAVSIFNGIHNVTIGDADSESYRDSFINCVRYLLRVKKVDPEAIYMSITQNHLPGAGGSLVHPHLQVHASKKISNTQKIIKKRTREYKARYGTNLLSDLIKEEKKEKKRYIGQTGAWEWTAAFAPSGFYEIWGISDKNSSLLIPEKTKFWHDLAKGVLNTQKFYKSLNRNSYNLSLISIEDGSSIPCLKVSLTARSSYAPWVRNDFTGFEISSGEMATFVFPESIAAMARKYWKIN